MSAQTIAPVHPAFSALSTMREGLAALIEACDTDELSRLDRESVLALAGDFEGLRNQMCVVDHAVIAQCETRHFPAVTAHRGTADLLGDLLHLSRAEAFGRVTAAAALSPRRSLGGVPMDPVRPAVAAAQRAGTLTDDQISLILGAVTRVSRSPVVTDEGITWAETTLVRQAQSFGPRELRQCAELIVDRIDPDGTLANERTQQADREVRLTPLVGGGAKINGYLTPPCAEALRAVLDPLAAPRPETDGKGRSVPDERSTSQRNHDALTDACLRLLRSGTLPTNGGTPATILITISLADLMSGSGLGRTTSGEHLTARHCLTLAAEARIIPVVMDSNGVPLHVGRSRRLATPAQCYALTVRDKGCSFPSCTHPPEWTEKHHIQAGTMTARLTWTT